MTDLTYKQYCNLVNRLLIIDEVNYESRDHNRAVCKLQEFADASMFKPEEEESQPAEKECPLKPQSGRPTEEDGDHLGLVQYLCNGVWGYGHWSSVAPQDWSWCHTPRWASRPDNLRRRLEWCTITSNGSGSITYHVPKELADQLKEYLTKK
ncbi:hypothetical protein SCRM01_285 [Synechococcus phage S-CRM01]|uniref:hypothetical protein n=1 Tax=Synechococcus phage S-CRM01 TaxID=1026955 RepID=UPI000209E319|nr:hypothetical protein SCRM01_285 [Synechococcus phage S-CRM01]AEC53231.1 hypothetical protein SCRM01_285 [Synechococcus phage S-CRM01]